MLSAPSAFQNPAAAGMANAAASTASQKRKTLMPALRIASPTAFFLPARCPMIALQMNPTAANAPHSGPGNQG